MYEFTSRIRFSEVDQNQKLTLLSVLNYFQDCCTFQSEELGVGISYMEERKQMWVLRSWEIGIHRYPVLGETVHIGTIPYDFQKMTGSRCFVMKDEQGQALAWADSEWVLMDTVRMRPALIDDTLKATYPVEESCIHLPVKGKIALPEKMEEKDAFPIHSWHLDVNHHVNNGQYVQMAGLYLPEGTQVLRMRAEYKKSALLGDMIYPRVGGENGCYTVSLGDEKGKPYAVVEFEEI